MDFKSIIELFKVTVLLPIALLIYQLEKLGPINADVNTTLFWATLVSLIVSIISGLICIMSLTSAVGNEMALNDPEKSNIYEELRADIRVNKLTIEWTGLIHAITLFIGAGILFGIVIAHLDYLYKKPDDTTKPIITLTDTNIVSALNDINQSLKDIETMLRSEQADGAGASGSNCNTNLTRLMNQLRAHDANLEKLAAENSAHLNRHLDIVTAKIEKTCVPSAN